MMRLFITLVVFLLLSPMGWAKGVYMTTDEFAVETWPESDVSKGIHWLSVEDKAKAKALFDRDYPSLRIRYLQANNQTLWTLEEVGKEQLITVGVVVGDDGICQVKILAYRESRGGEIKYPFFTKQFLGATLSARLGLSTHIDNITGATLSVNAVKRVVAWALYLHEQVESRDY